MMLSSKNVLDDLITFEKPRFLTEQDFKSENKRTDIKSGDVLLTIVGTIGRVSVVPINAPIFTLQRSVAVLKPDLLNIDSRFLMYLLQSIFDTLNIEARGVAQKGIYLKTLRALEVFIPPLPEQKRIVAILDEAFAGISLAVANAEKNLANARELFESYLNNVFTQKGDGWEQAVMSDCFDVRDGTHDSPKYVEDGIPFVTQKNIREGGLCFEKTKFISESDHKKFYRRSNVSKGDILISMIGANRGMVCLVDDSRIFSIKNVGLIKFSSNVNMRFILFYFKSSIAKEYVELESRGGAQPFIGLTKLRAFPITLAQITVQNSVVSKLDALEIEIRQLEAIYQKKLTALNELKQSILQKAFTGELTHKGEIA